jgi:hypothetical protein
MKRLAFFAAVAAFSLFSCKSGKRELQILLTDAPGDFEEVNIDLKDVRVNFHNDTAGWVSLSTNVGIYNLLDFQNGVTTPIANGNVPDGTVKELRLILGKDNSVKVDGNVYPLQLSSHEQNGLKIKINKKLEKDLNSVTIDFEAAQSVVKESNGKYKLHPVIKIK